MKMAEEDVEEVQRRVDRLQRTFPSGFLVATDDGDICHPGKFGVIAEDIVRNRR